MRNAKKGFGVFIGFSAVWFLIGINGLPAVCSGVWNSVDFLPKGQLKMIRLDPGIAEGRAEFEWICLEQKYGEVLRKWDFSTAVQ